MRALRERQQRNFLATLLLSHGVPMLLGGDEIGRTQRGNNNAWCQDNELSWFDWELDEARERLLEFTRRLVAAAARAPGLPPVALPRRRSDGSTAPRLVVVQAGRKADDRTRLGEPRAAGARAVSQRRRAAARARPDGDPIVDDSFLILVNAGHEPATFVLPPRRFGARWEVEIRTADPDAPPSSHPARARLDVEPRSLVLLRAV